MRKMRLELDALQVESFSTAGVEPRRGTVQAHSAYPCTVFDSCDPAGCTLFTDVSGCSACTGDPTGYKLCG